MARHENGCPDADSGNSLAGRIFEEGTEQGEKQKSGTGRSQKVTCRTRYLLKSWWGPVHDPQRLSVTDREEGCAVKRVPLDGASVGPATKDCGAAESTMIALDSEIRGSHVFSTETSSYQSARRPSRAYLSFNYVATRCLPESDPMGRLNGST